MCELTRSQLEEQLVMYKELFDELMIVNEMQQETINKYHEAMMLLAAENEKLIGEHE